jgi:hypothetical protein
MQFPWNRRADDEKDLRDRYEERLRDTQAQRPTVLHVAGDIRRHDTINGWTGTITAIFGTPKRRGGKKR